MLLDDSDNERAESYRVLADFFLKPPDAGELTTLKQDLELESKDNEAEILSDFNGLFMIPGGRLMPLESLFSADKGVAAINSVTAFYADEELTIDDEFQEIPDHISLEFLFMSYLIDTKRTDLQLEFLEAHIMNWVPDFCEEVIKQAGTGFYREIAGVTRDFLNNEYENIE
jgi:TorA maturation chaperone TorD